MAGFDEDRAMMAMAHDKAMQAIGPLQQAHSAVEEARGVLFGITEVSSQARAHQSLAALSRVMEEIVGLQQMVAVAVESSQGVAADL